MANSRSSGILLHITSLPSPYGMGDLGPEAYRFADFLTETKQKYWQILPLTPIEQGLGNSPYSSISAFAGNTLLISIDKLVEEGWLKNSDIKNVPDFPKNKVDFQLARQFKEPLLEKAAKKIIASEDKKVKDSFEKFCKEEKKWLDDFALFKALKDHFNNKQWKEWGAELIFQEPRTIEKYLTKLEKPILIEKVLQFVFKQQWISLKKYCNDKKIQLFGDLPIYVNFDSVDVWTNKKLFKLNHETQKPYFVAGTPPDYFSVTGQLWGNPVYDWDVIKKDKFRWWLSRIGHNISLFDLIRLDHFLGFVNYYEIPAEDETAINGKWVPAPASEFFQALMQKFADLPIIAEDLGTLSPAVKAFIRSHNLSGMKVLLFAFGDDIETNPYVPHNHIENCVVYTGTHDNNTIKGWWRQDASEKEKHQFGNYINVWVSEDNVADLMCQMAMKSEAKLVVLPLQDVLNLDESARMNVPGVADGNWSWKLENNWLNDSVKDKLLAYTNLSSRE